MNGSDSANPLGELPPAFVESVGALLGEAELPAFLAAYDQPAARGLRVNTRKTSPERVADLLQLPGEPVGWCPAGLYVPAAAPVRPSAHLAHRAGLYYLQEPSAMLPAELLAAGLGDELSGASVLDLAAAPGGKTTRLTELVGPDGLVVANEVERKRLGVLQENLDRWGASNVVTTSRPVEQLGDTAGAGFDAVLLDAPCSGEGMFRRDPAAIRQWSPAAVRGAARRQAGLLAAAARLVRPGGVLVYSTCTFAVEENEERVAELVAAEPAWMIMDIDAGGPVGRGVRRGDQPTERTVRIWPHQASGEGHFAAVLRLSPDAPGRSPAPVASSQRRRGGGRQRLTGSAGAAATRRAWREFAKECVPGLAGVEVLVREDRVFLPPTHPVPVAPELLVRGGLPLGRARPGRFEPAPALAGYLAETDAGAAVAWPPDDPRWSTYLSGAEVPDDSAGGKADAVSAEWQLVCAYGWGVGWVRRRGGVLKNFLAPAQRGQLRP